MSSLFENKRRGDRLGGIEGNELLVATTVLVFLTGVLLLAVGHKSGFLLELHNLGGGVALALELLPQMTGWRA